MGGSDKSLHIGMRSQPLGHATLQGHVWFCACFCFLGFYGTCMVHFQHYDMTN
jgi:hypothetical protein